MAGIVDNKATIAMGDNLSPISPAIHNFNAMESALARGPKLDFFQQIKEIIIFMIVAFNGFLDLKAQVLTPLFNSLNQEHCFKISISMVATPNWRGSWINLA